MKTVYEAANMVEAHMLQDLLKQEDIAATVQGAYLQGAAGGLPLGGLIRLEVDEDQLEAAREVIERWESLNPSQPTPTPQKRAPSRFNAGLVGMWIGVALMYAFVRVPTTETGIDHNGDGILDEKWTYSAGKTLLKAEVDRNLDGKVDYINDFDLRGNITQARSDDDFNPDFPLGLGMAAGSVLRQFLTD